MRTRFTVFALALILLWGLFAPALAEDGTLTVRARDTVAAFGANILEIDAPAAGELTVVIGDDCNEYRHMRLTVEAGAQQVIWDGLADDGQRIGRFNGKYRLRALLTSGEETWEAASRPEVGRSCQKLLFALPSAPVLYVGSEWFVELQAMRKGSLENIHMEVCTAGTPVEIMYSHDITVKTTDCFTYKWNGRSGKNALPAGDYVVSLWAEADPDGKIEFPLTVAKGPAPAEAIVPTGGIMPAPGMSDAEIWALMQQPQVVADVKAAAKLKLTEKPSASAKAVGTVYGQTQALEVLEVKDGWARVTAWSQEDGEQVTGYVPVARLKTVRPDSRYGLLVDKNTQTMTVFEDGSRIAELPVSTGLPAPGKLSRETAAGVYLTADRVSEYASGDARYLCAVRFAGHRMLQAVGYKKAGIQADHRAQTALLGQKAGSGSIRLPHLPAEPGGVDAWWLYSRLARNTCLVILDDPYARRVHASASKAGKTVLPYREGEGDRSEIPAFSDTAETVTVTFGGDAVIGTREAWMSREDAFPAYLAREGMAYPFSGLQTLFAADDLTMVNLECVLKANKAGEDTEKQYRFRGMPSWTEVLKAGSVEHVNIANNHYIDYGPTGKRATRAALEAAGIPYSGYGYTWIFEHGGHKIGFAGIRESIYKQDKTKVAAEIAGLREAGCDVVVYTCHWGTEYSAGHNDLQAEIARAAAEAGADLIIGGHPHVVQGISAVNGVPVVWSLGNLMFGGTIELTEFDALTVQARFVFEDGAYRGCVLELIPVMVSGRAAEGVNDCRPVVAQGTDRFRILQKIQADSDFTVSTQMWFPKQ